MPKLLIIRQFVFLLFGSDINERRNHIHVEIRKGRLRQVAKFWLEPKIELETKGNLTNKELNIAYKLIEKNYALLIDQVEKFKSGKKIKTIKK